MSAHTGENLRRLMAEQGLSIKELTKQTGLDRRTLDGILSGTNRSHPRTIRRLAQSLGVSCDEFFVTPSQLVYRRLDAQSDSTLEKLLQRHPQLFVDWTETDFYELHARFDENGALTAEEALQVAREMNHERQLHGKLKILLQSPQRQMVGEIINSLYRQFVSAE